MSEPLAERMRPRTLDDYVGQKHLVGEGAVLRKMIDAGRISSFILWGPPGVGKTTLAQIIANKLETEILQFSLPHPVYRRDTSILQVAARLLARSRGAWRRHAYRSHYRESVVRGNTPFAVALPVVCAQAAREGRPTRPCQSRHNIRCRAKQAQHTAQGVGCLAAL